MTLLGMEGFKRSFEECKSQKQTGPNRSERGIRTGHFGPGTSIDNLRDPHDKKLKIRFINRNKGKKNEGMKVVLLIPSKSIEFQIVRFHRHHYRRLLYRLRQVTSHPVLLLSQLSSLPHRAYLLIFHQIQIRSPVIVILHAAAAMHFEFIKIEFKSKNLQKQSESFQSLGNLPVPRLQFR